MPDIWQAVALSLANLLHTSVESAGFILGFVFITTIYITFMILFKALKVNVTPAALLFPTAVGLAFVGLTQWWPPWAIFLIVFVLIVIITKPIWFSNVVGG